MSDSTGLNSKRAAAAKKAIYAYLTAKKDNWDSIDAHIIDLLTDLCHLAAEEKLGPQNLMQTAYGHYLEEKE